MRDTKQESAPFWNFPGISQTSISMNSYKPFHPAADGSRIRLESIISRHKCLDSYRSVSSLERYVSRSCTNKHSLVAKPIGSWGYWQRAWLPEGREPGRRLLTQKGKFVLFRNGRPWYMMRNGTFQLTLPRVDHVPPALWNHLYEFFSNFISKGDNSSNQGSCDNFIGQKQISALK